MLLLPAAAPTCDLSVSSLLGVGLLPSPEPQNHQITEGGLKFLQDKTSCFKKIPVRATRNAQKHASEKLTCSVLTSQSEQVLES